MKRFFLPLLIEPVTIALYVIGGVAFVIFLYLLLDKFVFVGRKNRKAVEELRRKYEYIHSLLIGQDSAYIKRLEIISDLNLLFRPIYEDFHRQYENLRDNDDRQARIAVEKLEKAVGGKNHKLFKEIYANQRVIIINFENEVNALHQALEKVIQPETEARQAAVNEKELYRKIRANHQLHRSEIEPLDPVFQRLFTYVDQAFSEFDRTVETANYDDAAVLLERISKTLTTLDKILDVAPDLCVRTYNLIPQKIDELEVTYDRLTLANYPLHHLMVVSFIDNSRLTLKEIGKKLAKFEVAGVDEQLKAITTRIEGLLEAFEKEKAHRVVFENNFEMTYQGVKDLERQYIRLANILPQVKKVYAIPETSEQQMENLREQIDYVSSLKRSLDTFLHSATKQPFSVLVEKLEHLQTVAQKASAEMETFSNELEQLKTDVEAAFSLINQRYFELKKAEADLRELRIPAYAAQYKLIIDQCYTNIEQINALVHVQPIDVMEVVSLARQLEEQGAKIISDLEADLHLASLAENAMVYANNYRYNFSDIKATLQQDEALFLQGQFEKAYLDAGAILKKYNHE